MIKYAPLFLLCLIICVERASAQEDSISQADKYTLEESDNEYILVNPEEASNTDTYQGQPLQAKQIDPDDWKQVVGNTTFQESAEKKIEESKIPKQSNAPWEGNTLRIISFTLIIILLLILIYLIARNVRSENREVKNKIIKPIYAEEIEDIEEFDPSNFLDKAMAEGDYRLAIRLAFIDLLKKIHEVKAIHWKKDKTNSEYLIELSSQQYYEQIRNITRTYEIVWYGEQIPSKEDGEAIMNRFRTIQNLIGQKAV